LLAEYGTIIPQGTSNIRKKLPKILGKNPNNISVLMLSCFLRLHENFKSLDEEIGKRPANDVI